jgi:hypothetical protein
MSSPASLLLGALVGVGFFLWEWLVRHGPVDGAAVVATATTICGAVMFRVDLSRRLRRRGRRDAAERMRARRERRRDGGPGA